MAEGSSAVSLIDAPPPSTVPETSAPTGMEETTESKQPNGEKEESGIPKEDEQTAGPQATTEVTAPDGTGTTEVAEAPSEAVEDGPGASAKKGKRKSTGGVPEHKSKKTNKKAPPSLHLDCKPGEHYWARLKGFPPWPAIICDETMLPETLLGTRPVSTTRPDGSIREDFKEGGKNAKERTFPVMFLATNEFSWLVNTGLTPLKTEEVEDKTTAKMGKSLKRAYELASENHDLEYYKNVLNEFEEETRRIMEEQQKLEEEKERKAAAKAAEKEAEAAADGGEKKKKAKSRKSKGGDTDVEMEDADAPKSGKKRKKTAESDEEKPKKTPKITKLNAPKTPNGEAAASAKKSSSKPKKKVTAPKEEEQPPQMSEEEKRQLREKAILFLRHKLQKGFLARDKAPAEDEMHQMAEYFGQLEAYDSLEPAIIRTTKIHKVLKAIVKLASIPKDDEFHFKDRSHTLLEVWNKRMEEDGGAPLKSAEPKSATTEEAPSAAFHTKDAEEHAAAEPVTNGERKADDQQAEQDEKEAEEKEAETKVERETDYVVEKVEQKVEETAAGEQRTDAAPTTAVADDGKHDKPSQPGSEAVREADGDVSMQTAPETASTS